MFDALPLALLFLFAGAHARVPFWLVAAEAAPRRVWALAAPLLTTTTGLVVLWQAVRAPDRWLAAGLMPLTESRAAQLAVLMFLVVLVADGLTLFGHAHLPARGWRMLGGLGVGLVAVIAIVAELVRAADGPPFSPLTLALSTAGWAAVALALGQALRGPLSKPWAFAAAAGTLLQLAVTPAAVGTLVLASGAGWTAFLAAVLFAASPFVPARFRRLTPWLAFVLVVLWLTQAGEFARQLGQIGPSPAPP